MDRHKLFSHMLGKYIDPKYPFKDRLYFLFGTAGAFSAFAAFIAAIISGLPAVAAVASFASFVVMVLLMGISFCMKNIYINRIVCSLFLNFFMFPALFWVTGGIDCGMIFYFILGLCVATLILEGKLRIIVLAASLTFYTACLYLGFWHPELGYRLSYEERSMDTVSSFIIVSIFIIAVIMIMSMEYQKEHNTVLDNAAVLKQQAETDNLTTLYNQRYLMGAMEKEVQICGGEDEGAAIIMFDIDDFKRVNDAKGHLCGNQVLCRFSAILKESVKEKDVAARYGGEEFVVLLPGCGREEACKTAEGIRLAVYKDQQLEELVGSRLTVSGGVAAFSRGISIDEWIRQADMNMYAAKAAGKNRIIG